MNQITPYPIWIGHATEGQEFSVILETGIEAVVELAAEELVSRSRRDLIFCRFPLLDGPDNAPALLGLAVATVARLLASGVPTLVCCSNGMSRAPAIVAAAVSLTSGEPPEECLVRVNQHRRCDISPGLWKELLELPR